MSWYFHCYCLLYSDCTLQARQETNHGYFTDGSEKYFRFSKRPTWPWTPPPPPQTSSLTGTGGSFPVSKATGAWGWSLTPRKRVRMNGAVTPTTPPPPFTFVTYTRTILTFNSVHLRVKLFKAVEKLALIRICVSAWRVTQGKCSYLQGKYIYLRECLDIFTVTVCYAATVTATFLVMTVSQGSKINICPPPQQERI